MTRFGANPRRGARPGGARALGVVALAFCVAVAALVMVLLGYRATRDWERSTLTAIEARGKEVLALLTVALERDMKGGHVVLLPFNEPTLEATPLYDLADRFASGFARFPYVESFFVWKNTGSADGVTVFFNRADRRPPWETIDDSGDPYPVAIRRDPSPVRTLVAAARSQAARGVPFTVFEHHVAGVAYQVLVHLTYRGPSNDLYGFVGLTVNLQWVRDNYFANVIQQVQQIGGDQNIGIEIVDDQGVVIAKTGPASSRTSRYVRAFPLLFSDRALMSYFSSAATNVKVPQWQARVNVANDATLLAVTRGVARTLGLLALAGLVTMVGAAFTVRAARAADRLVTLQSEFIASVTHEMKTPLALIRLAGDTFANGRYASPTTIQEYGQLVTAEADHLTRLIDNVLCFARISDPERAYSFERVDILDLIEESLGRFRLQLAELEFDVQHQLPIELPAVRADRAMLLQVIGNLIDNAVKHGRSGHTLIVRAHADDAWLHIEVADRGDGIPTDEVSRVFEKFYRGKGAKQHGTGLGLTIARRIVDEHGGIITINSVTGQGTSVDVALRVVRVDDRTQIPVPSSGRTAK